MSEDTADPLRTDGGTATPDGSRHPIATMLDWQRELLEAGQEGLAGAEALPDALATMGDVDVGQTPADVVYTENKLELLHYDPEAAGIDVPDDEREEIPILIVYALINKPYILDLQPDRSVVRRLLEAGHDVYLIDWNEPSRLDQHLGLADYVNRYVHNCVDVVSERSGQPAIDLLGYCMGGTMSAIYAALHPDRVNALGLMAAGLCFTGGGGVLETWGDDDYYDPQDVADAYGNVPAEFLDVGFELMEPVDNYVRKYITFAENVDDESFVENFARMERWLDDGVDVPGTVYAEFLEAIYQDNALYEGTLTVDGQRVDPAAIDMPVLQLMGEYDHLVPPAASRPFNDVVGTDDVTTIEYATGHIGLSVSSSSHEDVWPRAAEWFSERNARAVGAGDASAGEESTGEEGASDASAGETPASDQEGAADDARPVEDVSGIGPTFADRLRAAGVATTADLAAHDAATLAEYAETSERRAQAWLEQL